MKGLKTYALIAVLAACLTASAYAQGGPPQRRGGGDQGGPPMQGGRQGGDMGPGGPGQRRMGPPPELLVMRKDVQKELKLTDEQIEKLRDLFPPRDGGGMGMGPGGRGGDGEGRGQEGGGRRQMGRGGQGGERGGPPEGMERGPGGPGGEDRMDAPLKEVLNDGQMKRLKELRLQRQGAEALVRKDVAQQVGLGDELRQQIRGMIEEMRENMPRPEPGERPDPEQMHKAHEKMRAELNAKVLGLLSSKQLAKWRELTGREFKFDESIRPPRPPQPPQGGGEHGGGA